MKYPVFSSIKLAGLDPILGPEMKSTGEGIAIAQTKAEAFYKAFHWNEQSVNNKNEIFVDTNSIPEEQVKEIIQKLKEHHFIPVINQPFNDWVVKHSAFGLISLSKAKKQDEVEKRKIALKYNLQIFTEWETVEAFLIGAKIETFDVKSIQSWLGNVKQNRIEVVTGNEKSSDHLVKKLMKEVIK